MRRVGLVFTCRCGLQGARVRRPGAHGHGSQWEYKCELQGACGHGELGGQWRSRAGWQGALSLRVRISEAG